MSKRKRKECKEVDDEVFDWVDDPPEGERASDEIHERIYGKPICDVPGKLRKRL